MHANRGTIVGALWDNGGVVKNGPIVTGAQTPQMGPDPAREGYMKDIAPEPVTCHGPLKSGELCTDCGTYNADGTDL